MKIAVYLTGPIVGLLAVGARIYQLAYHPEWTEAQVLIELWPVWALGVAWLLAAFASGVYEDASG